jgi:hypothetical protein
MIGYGYVAWMVVTEQVSRRREARAVALREQSASEPAPAPEIARAA